MIHSFHINQFIVLKIAIINIIVILKLCKEIKQHNKVKYKKDHVKILQIQIFLVLNLQSNLHDLHLYYIQFNHIYIYI